MALDDLKTEAAIKALGGMAYRDLKTKGSPIFSVDLGYSKVTDAGFRKWPLWPASGNCDSAPRA